jgi:hypothetical protein
MSVHLFECSIAGNPPEPKLLEAVTLRLIKDSERERFDAELATKHYGFLPAHSLNRPEDFVSGRATTGRDEGPEHLTLS